MWEVFDRTHHEGVVMAEAKKKAVTKPKPAKKPVKTIKTLVTDKKTPVKVAAKETDKVTEEVKVVAKAGKRSSKSVKEIEEKELKVAKKISASKDTENMTPAKIHKPTRSRIERSGKKYREIAKIIDSTKTYSTAEACELILKTSPVKFDASVEIHINLGVDPKQADQNIRDTLSLPAGTGKTIKIAVLAEGEEAKQALSAGADIAGSDDLLSQIEKGIINFDVLIAKPALMPRLGKFAKILGPKGLMPNPKSGTVTNDVIKAVQQAKAGRVEYRVDSSGIVHLSAGKVSFGNKKIQQNIEAVMASVKSNKPSSIKGVYIKSAYLTTTMGPSIRLQV